MALVRGQPQFNVETDDKRSIGYEAGGRRVSIASIDTLGTIQSAMSVPVTVSRSVTLDDKGYLLICNSSESIVITVDSDSTIGWTGAVSISLYRAGAGSVAFLAGSGVVIHGSSSITSQGGTKKITRVGANEWSISSTFPEESNALSKCLASAMCTESRSTAIQVIGDSTGDAATEWPTLLAQALAAAYPSWTVKVQLFSDSTQKYGAATVIRTGPLGDRYFDGSTGSSTRLLAASQSPHLSGTIDVSVKMRLTTWIPAAQVNVFGKCGNAGYRGWYGYIDTSGRPVFAYSTDGTALATMTISTATGVTDDTDYWIRWVFTPDDGAGNRVFKAYKSPDGATWTQIGSTVTTAGAVTLYDNSTVGYECGGVTASAAVMIARLYEIEIRDGDGGKIVAPVMPDLWPPKASTSAYFTGSPTLTIVNGSVAGAGITGGGTYLADSTRLPKLLPNYGQLLCLLSTSHNDGYDHGRSYRATYKAWIDAIKVIIPEAYIALLTQNPEKSGSTWYREHEKRRSDIVTLAIDKGVAVIDTYNKFLSNTNWQTDYMADNVHPNSSGQGVWIQEIKNQLNIL